MIARNLLFREYGVEFHIDGWDAKARVGFEFLSSEDDDHDDLNLAEYQTLAAAQQRGELALFIIDEVEPLSAADLALQANDFLDEVAEARQTRPLAAPRRKKAVNTTRRPAGNASGGAKKSAKKKAVTKHGTTIKKRTVAAGKPRVAVKAPKKRPTAGSTKVAGKKPGSKKVVSKKAARTR